MLLRNRPFLSFAAFLDLVLQVDPVDQGRRGEPVVVGSSEPDVALDKDGNITVTPGSRVTYTLGYQNNGSDPAGLPLYSTGLVFSDTMPVSTTFTATETVSAPLKSAAGSHS